MPIYEFKCNQCSVVFESFVTSARYSDKMKCPKCGSEQVVKQMSSFSCGSGLFGNSHGISAPSMPTSNGCGTGGFS